MSFVESEEVPGSDPRENLRTDVPSFAPPSKPPFTSIGGLLLFVFFCAAALLITPLLVGTSYAVLKPLFHWKLSGRALVESTFFQVIAQAVFYVFLIIYVYAWVVGYGRWPFWSAIRWKSLPGRQVSVLIATGIGLTIAVGLLSQLMPDEHEFPLEKLFSSPGAAYTIALFAIFIAPFMEELIFRGILFAFFEAKAGVIAALFVTAVVFTAFHVEEYWGAWHHLLLILLVGLTLSSARAVTGWLTPSIVIHMTYNACLMLALYIQTQHFQNIPVHH